MEEKWRQERCGNSGVRQQQCAVARQLQAKPQEVASGASGVAGGASGDTATESASCVV